VETLLKTLDEIMIMLFGFFWKEGLIMFAGFLLALLLAGWLLKKFQE